MFSWTNKPEEGVHCARKALPPGRRERPAAAAAAAAATLQTPPKPPERSASFVWSFEDYKRERPKEEEEEEAEAPPELASPEKRPRVAAAVPRRFFLPWERWAPKRPEDFLGNKRARDEAAAWLAAQRWQQCRKPVAAAMLLLQGDSGTGKSCTADWLLRSQGFAVCRYDGAGDLARFLRRVVATDLGGKRSAILLDEADELFAVAPEAFKVVAQCVVVATANAPPRELRQTAAKVVRFYRHEPHQARRLLELWRPELSEATRAALAAASCGDYRQLAIRAVLAKPDVAAADVFRTPYDVAKDVLCGRGGSASEASSCGLSCDLVRWNFAGCNDLAACAAFQADCCALEAWHEASGGGFELDASFMVPFVARVRGQRRTTPSLEQAPQRLWQPPPYEPLPGDVAAAAAAAGATAAERMTRLQRAGASRRLGKEDELARRRAAQQRAVAT
jgi:hypothetical protein